MKNIVLILVVLTTVASGYSQVVGDAAYLKTRVSQVPAAPISRDSGGNNQDEVRYLQ